MPARTLWSPSRVKAALQCGRRLQGMEEKWERAEHIRGIRGRAVHRAVEKWEAGDRQDPVLDLVVDAWYEIVPDTRQHKILLEDVRSLWTDAEKLRGDLADLERTIEENNPGRWKAIRQTKVYHEGAAELEEKHQVGPRTLELRDRFDALDWPWESEKGVYFEGVEHSLDTTRRGTDYLRDLWPEPDILGAEWSLETTLPHGLRVHGYIDRVEGSDGIEVVDYKSSRFQETPLDHFLQVATYAILAEDHLGFAPDRVRLAYLRDQDSDVFAVQEGWRERLDYLVTCADRVLADRAFAPSFAGCGICSFYHFCETDFVLVPPDMEEAS